MISANELRIGNLVNYEGNPFYIWSEITKYSVDLDDKETKHVKAAAFDELEPIPITEEWLLNLGFTNWVTSRGIENDYFVHNNLFPVKINFYLPYNYLNIYIGGITLKYVHQLQNLYFALTGKELEIK